MIIIAILLAVLLGCGCIAMGYMRGYDDGVMFVLTNTHQPDPRKKVENDKDEQTRSDFWNG